jgi:hypothetical protein
MNMSADHAPLLSGLYPYPEGQVALSRFSLRLYRALDAMFVSWADDFAAEDHLFPPMLAAAELDRTGYFQSFPHLVSFPASLDRGEENLRAFARRTPTCTDGEVPLTQLASVRTVLAPSACYHFYGLLAAKRLDAPTYVTTCATCFRTEATYTPLARQRSFSMREIVCLGTAAEVERFLARMASHLRAFFERIGLPITFASATDPFFDPRTDPKFYAQRLEPLKTELVADGSLAIGSINFHRSFFGRAFDIEREGVHASSGCVAFGVERWMRALSSHFGSDPDAWPSGLRSELGLGCMPSESRA